MCFFFSRNANVTLVRQFTLIIAPNFYEASKHFGTSSICYNAFMELLFWHWPNGDIPKAPPLSPFYLLQCGASVSSFTTGNKQWQRQSMLLQDTQIVFWTKDVWVDLALHSKMCWVKWTVFFGECRQWNYICRFISVGCGKSKVLKKCELLGMRLVDEEGWSTLDLWFSSGLPWVNFQPRERWTGGWAPSTQPALHS